MEQVKELLISIFALGVSVAVIAVLVSRKSQTPAVIQSWFSGTSNFLATAEAPVTGAKANPILDYPSSGLLGGGLNVGDINLGY